MRCYESENLGSLSGYTIKYFHFSFLSGSHNKARLLKKGGGERSQYSETIARQRDVHIVETHLFVPITQSPS